MLALKEFWNVRRLASILNPTQKTPPMKTVKIIHDYGHTLVIESLDDGQIFELKDVVELGGDRVFNHRTITYDNDPGYFADMFSGVYYYTITGIKYNIKYFLFWFVNEGSQDIYFIVSEENIRKEFTNIVDLYTGEPDDEFGDEARD